MRPREAVLVAVLVAGAAGVGFVVGRETRPADDGAGSPRSAQRESIAAAKPVDPTPPVDGAPVAAPQRAPQAAQQNEPPIGPAPKASWTAREILLRAIPDAPAGRLADADARAARIRAEAQGAAEQADVTAAYAIAEEIRKERAFLADEARGGTMNLLRALKRSKTHPFDLVGAPERFAALFERTANGPALQGTDRKLDASLADGATIAFPAGVHEWRVNQLGRGSHVFPRDLLVVGVGMDATILKLDEFNAQSEVASLTFRDLTIDCSDNYLTDLRSENPITLRLERCRVVGFDMGAGGSVMFSANTAAFFATDSRFEAGFGRAPGFGNLFRCGALLARLDRCAIVGPFRSVYDAQATSTDVFADCVFTNCDKDFATRYAAPPDGVRFERCTADDVAVAEISRQRIAFLARVAAASGGTRTLFSLLAAYRQTLAPLASDREAFLGLFEERASGLTLDGATAKLTAVPAPEAVTLVFPAGAFEFDQQKSLGGFKGDLTLVGQGMETTLLRVRGDVRCRSVQVRDMTLDLSRGALRDAGNEVAFHLQRCRVVGFDRDALFAAGSPTLVLAEDSRIEEGYGEGGRGSGVVFQANSRALVARMERCTIRATGASAFGSPKQDTALVFQSCRLSDVDPGLRARIEREDPDLSLVACTVDYRADSKPPDTKRHPLSELNPSWPDR